MARKNSAGKTGGLSIMMRQLGAITVAVLLALFVYPMARTTSQ